MGERLVRITHVTYERNGVVPGEDRFTRHKIGITVEVAEGESPDAAFERAVAFVESKLGKRQVRRGPTPTGNRELDVEDY